MVRLLEHKGHPFCKGYAELSPGAQCMQHYLWDTRADADLTCVRSNVKMVECCNSHTLTSGVRNEHDRCIGLGDMAGDDQRFQA